MINSSAIETLTNNVEFHGSQVLNRKQDMLYRVYKWNCLFRLLSVSGFLLYPSEKKNKPDGRLDTRNLNIRTFNLKMYVVEIRSRNLNSIITSSKMDSASKNRSLCVA